MLNTSSFDNIYLFYQSIDFRKGIGSIKVTVPRDRKGEFKSMAMEKYARSENSIKEDAALLYPLGTSTRSMSLISKHLFGITMSAQQVSNFSSRLTASVEKWRTRPIDEPIKYLLYGRNKLSNERRSLN